MKYSHSEIQEARKGWVILAEYNSIVGPIRKWEKAGNTFNVASNSAFDDYEDASGAI